ncbi:MAG: hypothetical protein HY558_01095 [Euryarchaeota archaeon]|nr:hypothetical protein [Euryarchaeota archaeon]
MEPAPPDPLRVIGRTADLIWRLWKTEPLTLVVPVRDGLRQARRNPRWYIAVAAYVGLGVYGLLRDHRNLAEVSQDPRSNRPGEGTGAARQPKGEPRPDRGGRRLLRPPGPQEPGEFRRSRNEGSGRAEKRRPSDGRRKSPRRRPAV